jgi:hypothetical protein
MVDPVYSYLTRSIHVALMLSLTFVLPLSAAHAVSAGPADVSGGNLEASSGVNSIFADGFDPAVVPCEPVQLLEDSSFEATNPDDFTNPFWPSSSTNFGTPFCTLDLCGDRHGLFGTANWNVLGMAGRNREPRDRASGTDRLDSVRQSSASELLAAHGYVVWKWGNGGGHCGFTDPADFCRASAAEPAYVQYTVDVSDFADGQQHVVAFTYVSPGDISNYSLDDVTLECVASGQ